MFCKKCFNSLEQDAKFCQKCGTMVDIGAGTQTQKVEPAQPQSPFGGESYRQQSPFGTDFNRQQVSPGERSDQLQAHSPQLITPGQQQIQSPPPIRPVPPVTPVPPVRFEEPAEGLATASMVMGILSFLTFGILLSIPGLIFAIVAKRQGNTSGRGTAGLILSIINIVFGVLLIAFIVFLVIIGMQYDQNYYFW